MIAMHGILNIVNIIPISCGVVTTLLQPCSFSLPIPYSACFVCDEIYVHGMCIIIINPLIIDSF